MRIMHNIPALRSYNALASTNDALSKAITKLSTGLRINSAADDAAGLAISEKMRSQIRGTDQASRNAQDGISMIQTAEGALSEVHSMLQRMRELSIQAANDTLTQDDRVFIDIEIGQLKAEIDRISTTTQFNRKQLLDGSSDVLWSTSSLSTKVVVRGPVEREGNYRVELAAENVGSGGIYKTNIMRAEKTKISPVNDHEVRIMPIEVDVPQGELVQPADNLGFPLFSFSFAGNDINGWVTVGSTTVNLTNMTATQARTELTNALNAVGNGLRGTSNYFHSVQDDTAAYRNLQPGPQVDISWDLSGGGRFLLYNGLNATLIESASVSSGVHTIKDDGSDITSISWDTGKDNNMRKGTYYVDICPQNALGAAIGDVRTTRAPFNFTTPTVRESKPGVNTSIAFEVSDIDTVNGHAIVAFSYYYMQIDAQGNILPSGSGAFVLDLNDTRSDLLNDLSFGGVKFANLNISRDISQYEKGDKFTVTAAAPRPQASVYWNQLAITEDITTKKYFLSYAFEPSRFDGTPIDVPFYQIDANDNFMISNIQVTAKGGSNISHNHTGWVHPLYSAKFTVDDTGNTTKEHFQEAFIFHTLNNDPKDTIKYTTAAEEDTSLRDIQQMYTAGGAIYTRSAAEDYGLAGQLYQRDSDIWRRHRR